MLSNVYYVSFGEGDHVEIPVVSRDVILVWICFTVNQIPVH